MALEAVGDTREFTLQDRVDHILKDEKVKQQVLESLDALARTPGAAKHFSSDAASLRRGVEGFESVRGTPGLGELESIILRIGRPVLFVQNNTFDTSGLSTAEPLIADWRDRARDGPADAGGEHPLDRPRQRPEPPDVRLGRHLLARRG